MKTQQSGFTLIELVMVIVILGILAAVALPRFTDLSGSATAAAVSGLAGSLNSADAVNTAACAAGDANCVDTTANCTQDGLNTCSGLTDCSTAASSITQNLDTGDLFIVNNGSDICYVADANTFAGSSVNARFDVSAADNDAN